MKTFYMVLVEGKSDPKKRHSTFESAFNEAKRLAEQEGKTAHVLESISTIHVEKLYSYHGRTALLNKKTVDGWIEWKGGRSPLPSGVRYEIRLRNGTLVTELDNAPTNNWLHENSQIDIVAYRVVGAS